MAPQSPSRAKRKLDITIRLTDLNLTPRWRCPTLPHNSRTTSIRTLLHDPIPRKRISKYIAKVIPDLIGTRVQRIREHGLRGAVVEPVGVEGDFESFAAGLRVTCEGLGVDAAVGGDGGGGGDGGADGPEGYVEGTLVPDAGGACKGGGCEGEEGEDGEAGVHDEFLGEDRC